MALLTVRCSRDELADLKARAAAAGMTASDYVRVHCDVAVPWRSFMREVLVQSHPAKPARQVPKRR